MSARDTISFLIHHLSSSGKERISEAIHFFSRAQAYGNAIRLCKEYHMEDQLLNLALLGQPHDMIDAAKFYEKTTDMRDKAGNKGRKVFSVMVGRDVVTVSPWVRIDS